MGARKIFYNSVASLPQVEGLTSMGMMVNYSQDYHRQEEMTLLFHFSIPDKNYDELKARITSGDVLTLDELTASYSSDQNSVEKLTAWLQSEGFEVLGQSPDSLGIYAKATVAQIERSLQTVMMRVTMNGIAYNAASTPPSLPVEVGDCVESINGLQPYRQMHKKMRRVLSKAGNRAALGANAVSGAATAVNNSFAPPYVVSEIMSAYNAAGLGYTGSGQTIAILIDTVPNDSDLVAFWQANYVNTDISRITKINVNNYPSFPPVEGEETLDTEWASGIAPGADIRIYATGTLSSVDIINGLDMVINDAATIPGMRQLSISLGLGELYYGSPAGEVAAQHQKYMRLAALGVNIFISSGDAGSNPDQAGHSPTGGRQVEFGASDSFTIGVGGTSLILANDGSVASETAWNSSGGGISIFFNRPSWQSAVGFPQVAGRMVPDVSVVADPNTGAFLVIDGKVAMIGGTSWSTPVWAGFCALINEARATAQLPALPFLNPVLYRLAGTACFRDITQGSNGAYFAGPGYDMVTGLGVPNVAALIAALT